MAASGLTAARKSDQEVAVVVSELDGNSAESELRGNSALRDDGSGEDVAFARNDGPDPSPLSEKSDVAGLSGRSGAVIVGGWGEVVLFGVGLAGLLTWGGVGGSGVEAASGRLSSASKSLTSG